jgi:cobalt/nickel transport system permease protein
VKTLALLAFLAAVATTPPAVWQMGGYALLLMTGILLARLPLAGLLLRAAVVLPFTAMFAVMSVLAGDRLRALALVEKSYLSALAALLLAASTPLPELLRGLESMGAPRMLLLTLQFLYRYLFVISEQAQHMRLAAECRRGVGSRAGRRPLFRAAAGALGVLFARSYARADAIHRAMLARGFDGHIRLLSSPRLRWADIAFLAAAVALPLAIRFSAAG